MSENEPKTDYGLDEPSSVFSSENASRVGKFAREKMEELRMASREGHLSIRLLAQCGGLAMMALSLMGFVMKIIHLEILGALVEVYTFFMGLIVVILEAKAFPKHFEQNLYRYALFLRYVWGRGCLYFFAGSLQATQGKLADLVVGCFMILVGIMDIMVGRRTAQKLAELRKSLITEEDLHRKFQECDLDGTGTLTMVQFSNLTANMGLELSRREMEAALAYVDEKDNGEITYEDFQTWWTDWDLSSS